MDPNDVITHTQLKIENNGITPHTAIVKKNYEHMVKRAEKSHNPFRRLLHAIGVSYAEDNVLNTSINRTNNFKNTNSIEEINNHFKEMYQKRIDSVTKELNPVSEDKKNLDKKLDNELNKNNINKLTKKKEKSKTFENLNNEIIKNIPLIKYGLSKNMQINKKINKNSVKPKNLKKIIK